MIEKIERGYVNDDFIHDRETLRATFDNGEIAVFKLYRDGMIVSFIDLRMSDPPDRYEEHEISIDLKTEIEKHLT
jgi:hypothetical protein